MKGDTSILGSMPPPPALLVGRAEDMRKLRDLLTRQFRTSHPRSVRLQGEWLKAERAKRTLTQEALAQRAGLGVKVIKNAEAGKSISLTTAELLAQVFGKSSAELPTLSEDTVTRQVLTTIHGWPGVGKTTLARSLAHDKELKQAFTGGVLWASLGPLPNLLSELATWGRALGIDGIGPPPGTEDQELLEYARHRLSARLRDERMLLILDDVWQAEHAFALAVGGRQCSVLVTTRLPEVADRLAASDEDVYRLDVLDEAGAEELLERLAPQVVTEHRQEARDLARQLERLPLALQIAGPLQRIAARNGLGVAELLRELRDATRLLREKPPVDVAAESMPTITALLQKSTGVLDEQARRCFAYLAPYAPKPATFDLGALKSQWTPMGVEPKTMADLLIERGLLEPLGDGWFWMHALLVAHASSLLTLSAQMK